MSSPIDYIFMNSRDKGVVIINILSSSRISIEFMMRNTILSLDEFYYHQPLYCLPTNTTCSCLVLYLEFPAIQQLFFFTRNITISYVINVVRITPPLKNFWYSDASHHHHSFLGPRVEWTLLCNFNISSNPIASELLDNDSNLVCWLLNRHSDVGRATQPIFRVHLSTHV